MRPARRFSGRLKTLMPAHTLRCSCNALWKRTSGDARAGRSAVVGQQTQVLEQQRLRWVTEHGNDLAGNQHAVPAWQLAPQFADQALPEPVVAGRGGIIGRAEDEGVVGAIQDLLVVEARIVEPVAAQRCAVLRAESLEARGRRLWKPACTQILGMGRGTWDRTEGGGCQQVASSRCDAAASVWRWPGAKIGLRTRKSSASASRWRSARPQPARGIRQQGIAVRLRPQFFGFGRREGHRVEVVVNAEVGLPATQVPCRSAAAGPPAERRRSVGTPRAAPCWSTCR